MYYKILISSYSALIDWMYLLLHLIVDVRTDTSTQYLLFLYSMLAIHQIYENLRIWSTSFGLIINDCYSWISNVYMSRAYRVANVINRRDRKTFMRLMIILLLLKPIEKHETDMYQSISFSHTLRIYYLWHHISFCHCPSSLCVSSFQLRWQLST